jgi:hypothetical protein
MAEPTVGLSPEELWERRAFSGGRVSAAVNEVLRRLRTELPGYIDYANGQLGLSGDLVIPGPLGYYVAPERLLDEHLNCLLASASLQKVARGTQNFHNRIVLTIYLVYDRSTVAEEINTTWDAAELVAQVLHQYLTGCVNEAGQVCWRSLTPQVCERLPHEWRNCGGVAMPYLLVQDPSDEVWM